MRYTQGQVRALLTISVDTFRTWRDAIPALAAHKGHAPTFTPGDVVAVAVVEDLVRNYGVRIGVLAERLDQLFIECHGRSWLSLERCVVLLETGTLRLIAVDALSKKVGETTTILVPCAPIIERLRGALAATETEDHNCHLQFPIAATSR